MPRKVRSITPHPTDPAAALVELTRGYYAIIDYADSEEVGKSNWYAQLSGDGRRVYAMQRSRELGEFLLHRFVATRHGLDMSDEIDHRNMNTLDCRGRNLRSATHSQNDMNRGPQRNSKSGVKGVSWHRPTEKWCARVATGGTNHYVGLFTSVEAAADAVAAKRKKLHGEFSRSK